MTRIRILFILLLVAAGMGAAQAQGLRVGDRAWYTIRGGLFLGMNQSFHSGDVPMLPLAENGFYGETNGTNIVFGVHGEKAFTRSIAMGLRLTFDQMSGTVDGRFTEPYRIADDNGVTYPVVRDHEGEYTLQYLSLGLYAKLYPLNGPGFFVLAGGSAATLLKGDYSHTATIVEPDWARGSESPALSGEIPEANDVRFAAQLGLGYDFWFRYGFVTPSISYEFGLTPVSEAKWMDNWTVDNVKILVELTFPIP
ncbi:MAG TPA: outer membrane beta-barrel protein [Bacteroidota bacterium]|nr:outer membrane beta-barrel protein [Bacteroidota bacterium]